MRRATAPATCRTRISCPSAVSMTIEARSFSVLAFGSQAFMKFPFWWNTDLTRPSTGYQLAWTFVMPMKMEIISRRSWKYSHSSTSSSTTTRPSAGATTVPSVGPLKMRMGQRKKLSIPP